MAKHAGVGGEFPCVDELRRVVDDEEVDRPEADQRTDVRRVEAMLGGDLRGAAERGSGVVRVCLAMTAPDDLQRGAQLVRSSVGLGKRNRPRRQCGRADRVAGAEGGVGGDRDGRRVVGSVSSFDATRGVLPSTVCERCPGQSQAQFGVLVAARRPQRGLAELGGLTGVTG